jgi:nitrogenase subunit NifH
MFNTVFKPSVFTGNFISIYIIKAYAKSVSKNDEMSKMLLNGNIRVSELKEKEDIIMMVFSTPVKEEVIAYYVDCQNKTISKQILPEYDSFSGTFSNFFEWNKN